MWLVAIDAVMHFCMHLHQAAATISNRLMFCHLHPRLLLTHIFALILGSGFQGWARGRPQPRNFSPASIPLSLCGGGGGGIGYFVYHLQLLFWGCVFSHLNFSHILWACRISKLVVCSCNIGSGRDLQVHDLGWEVGIQCAHKFIILKTDHRARGQMECWTGCPRVTTTVLICCLLGPWNRRGPILLLHQSSVSPLPQL